MHGKPTALGAFTAYLELFIENMERLRIVRSSEILFDDQVMQSIDDFLPFKNEVLGLFKAVAQYSHIGEFGATMHRFFERLLEYTGRPEGVTQYRDDDWDNFKFFAHELFTSSIAIFIRFERFEFISILTTRRYILPKSVRERGSEPVGGYGSLNQNLVTFEARKRRLNSNRISLQADKLMERTAGSVIDAREFCQADFVLYIKCEILKERWYPISWIYIGEHSGTLEIFARGFSTEYFERVISKIFNITGKDALVAVANDGMRFSAGWSSINAGNLMGIERLATKP